MVSTKLLRNSLLECLEKNGIQVDAMYIFGSFARGAQTPTSDVDVLVVSPSFEGKNFWGRCSLIGEALGEIALPVEVYPVTSHEFKKPELGGFLESILADCRTLYKRKKDRNSCNRRLSLRTK